MAIRRLPWQEARSTLGFEARGRDNPDNESIMGREMLAAAIAGKPRYRCGKRAIRTTVVNNQHDQMKNVRRN